MARMSRVWFLLVIVLSLVLVGCTQGQEDALADPSGEPTPTGGEVVIGEGEGVIAVEGSPTAEGVDNGVSSDGSLGADSAEAVEGAEDEGAEGEAAYPAPESAPAEGEATGEAVTTTEPQTTTVAVTEPQAEATPTSGDVAAADAAAQPAEAAPAPPAETTYTVRAGDTLYAIAASFSTTVEDLRARNNLADNLIYEGQVLTVPAQSASAPAPGTAPGTVIHEVRGGEWLLAIARQYNTTPEAIMAANGLVNTLIYPGQRLVIPTQ
ncbi:MAG TPA: LysM peptidoglycan-binding domain-containing protein [Ardenticatenaceae bacterium]